MRCSYLGISVDDRQSRCTKPIDHDGPCLFEWERIAMDKVGNPIEVPVGPPMPQGKVRQFETGATRDTDEGKPDYEGFLSPAVIRAFGEYMSRHRVQSDGSLRDSDNWQKGIPRDQYIKSMFRHFVDVWEEHRNELSSGTQGHIAMREALCALLFNVQGYLHEYLKGSPAVGR